MSLITTFAAHSGKYGKLIFAGMKAVEVGKATMAAFSAHNLALANPPGPPTTIPMAEAVLALGLSKAAMIAATAIGSVAGGGIGGGGAGGGGTITTPSAIEPTFQPATTVQNQKREVNIYIEGDSINDEEYLERWAEKISEMVEDSEIRLIASNSKYAEELA